MDKSQKAGKAGKSISAQTVMYVADGYSLVEYIGGVPQKLYRIGVQIYSTE